jgi:hypothetical protein
MNMAKMMLKIIVNKVIKAIVMMRVRIRMNKMMIKDDENENE